MTITLDIEPELANELRAEAMRHGQDSHAYLREMLLQNLSVNTATRRRQRLLRPAPATPEERIQSLQAVNALVNSAVPPLSEEATRRESVYEDIPS